MNEKNESNELGMLWLLALMLLITFLATLCMHGVWVENRERTVRDLSKEIRRLEAVVKDYESKATP